MSGARVTRAASVLGWARVTHATSAASVPEWARATRAFAAADPAPVQLQGQRVSGFYNVKHERKLF